jgi:lysophospholipase L1-like esterase
MMQRDHAHPNADGARQIADNIWPYLLPLVEKTPALTR